MIKKRYIKVILGMFVVIFFVAACAHVGAGTSRKIAKVLKKEVPAFSKLMMGELNISDEGQYYQTYVEQIMTDLSDLESANVSEEQRLHAQAAVEIFRFLAVHLNENVRKGTYLGEQNADKTISGIYIYEWENKINLDVTADQINASNQYVLSGGHGDLIFIKANCLVVVLGEFAVKQAVSAETLNKALAKILA